MATDVVARLKLRAENFQREVRKAFDDVPAVADKAGRDAGTRMGTGIGLGLKAALAAVSVGAIVNELAQVTSRAIDFGVELGNNARVLNTNVEELQAYRQAAGEVNVSHQQLDDGLQQLLKTMVKAEGGNKDAVATFKGLNVELRDVDGQAKSTTEVMGEVIDQIRRIPDPLRQAQYGASLFGDQWASVAPILHAGSEGLQALTGDILATGNALSTKEVQSLEWVNSELERMKNALAVDVSQTVARNSESLVYMAERLYAVGHAAVYALDKVSQFLAMGAVGPGGSNAIDENRRIAGRNHRGKTVDLGDGLALAVGNQRQFAKGGRGGGRSYEENERVARGDDLRDMRAFVRPIADPLNAARLGGSGGGSSRGRGAGGGGGVDKEARDREQAAKRLKAEWDRLSESLDGQVAKQREAAEIEAIRAQMGDRAAERQKALLDVNRQNAKLIKDSGLTKTADELAKEFGVAVSDASAALDKLTEARRTAVIDIDLKYDKAAADQATKLIAAGMREQIEAQKTVSDQYREEQAEQARRTFEDLSSAYFDLFDGNTRNLWDNFKRLGLNALAELAANQTLKLLGGEKLDIGGSLSTLFKSQKGDLVGNMSKGALASSIAGAVGIGQSKTGSMVGSLLGSSGLATKLLGSTLGPFGAALGGVLGGTIGGLLKKTPRGFATIGGDGADLRITGSGGNSNNAKAQGTKAAGGVLTSLDQIAAALGGTYDASRGKVSIGRSGDSWHVDTTGQGKLKKSQGGFDFDDDYEAAVRFATMDLIKDGVLKGISDAAQRILQSGDDIEMALEKALMIEDIPKRLKARLDPLGAALDEVDAKFARLSEILKEGGASAEQVAQARQLWELERADAVREIGQASSVLRDYLKTLRIGADSPLSLRTQAVEAEAAMAPFVAQIRKAEDAKAKYDQLAASKAAGGAVSDADLKAAKDAATAAASAIDQSGFRDSAALFLDVARQLGGSTKSFFDQFDRIQGLTNNAIALVENAVPLRGDAKDPFVELTAKSTQATANILDQQTQLLIDIRNGIYAGGGGTGGDFIGGGRNFVEARR